MEQTTNPILLFDGDREIFDSLPIREQCGHFAIHIARSIELLLKIMNKNEEKVVVSRGKEVITEIELIEDIAIYMRLHNSLIGNKPE